MRPARGPASGLRRSILPLLLGIGFLTAGTTRTPDAGAQPPDRPIDYSTNAELPSDFVLGLEASQAIAQNIGLVEADSLVRKVNDIGYRVALVAGRPDILFTFQILNMDEPNAMALPGGWVFLTRGILEIGLTDPELANLIGHEVSHVTHKDFSRQGRLDGLLSLLQTAIMVAVSMAGSSSTHSPVIEAPGTYDYPQSSADAALQGTVVFGSVFHELLLRGYSRKIEMEADDGGRRLAALAGYPRQAGESLLVKLHDRIYEDREYGYWRTHPYFVDRVAVARGARPGNDVGPSAAEVAAYRLGVQQGLASAAGSFRDERLATYLYELALRAGTAEGSNFAVHRKLLQFRLERADRKSRLLRSYGPLASQYDSLLAAGSASGVDPTLLSRIAATRDSIRTLRDELLPRYLEAIGSSGVSNEVLETFVRNFPTRPEARRIRLELARSYRLSSRPDLAIERLSSLLETPADSSFGKGESTDAVRVRAEVLETLPLVGDPATIQRLLDLTRDPEIVGAANSRMEALADTLGRLDAVGRFVQTHPSSPITPRFRERLATLADLEYKKGRLAEALGDQQAALTIYNRIAILAPETTAAIEARRGIIRIQALANADR